MVRMFVLIKSQTTSKMGNVGSKTRSLGQILEKHCVRSRGQIFSPVIMKFRQNVYLVEILDNFKIGHVGSKTVGSLGEMIEKHCIRIRGHIFRPIVMKLGRNFFF